MLNSTNLKRFPLHFAIYRKFIWSTTLLTKAIISINLIRPFNTIHNETLSRCFFFKFLQEGLFEFDKAIEAFNVLIAGSHIFLIHMIKSLKFWSFSTFIKSNYVPLLSVDITGGVFSVNLSLRVCTVLSLINPVV